MDKTNFYVSGDLPAAGATDYPTKFNALMAAVQGEFDERDTAFVRCLAVPSAAATGGNTVNLVGFDFTVWGTRYAGNASVVISGANGTRYLLLDANGVLTGTATADDPTKALIGTVAWDGSLVTGDITITCTVGIQRQLLTAPPAAHAATHAAGADDEITPAAIGAIPTSVVVTTVGDPGSDSNVPSEQAVREALNGKSDTGHNHNGSYVALTGDQTVAGVKTFSSSPIVPTPTTDYQAATKKYVDDNAGGGGSDYWRDAVKSRQGTPPVGGTANDRYIVVGGTGDWAGHDNDIATYTGSGFTYETPEDGWSAYVLDDDAIYSFDGTSWETSGGGSISIIENGGTPITDVTSIEFADGTNTSVSVTDNGGGSVTVTVDATGGGASSLTKEWRAGSLDFDYANTPAIDRLDGTNVRRQRLRFDDTTEEFANGGVFAPANLDAAGTVTFRIVGAAVTPAASKNVQFKLYHLALANDEAGDAAFSSKVSGDKAISGTAGDVDIFSWTETVANLGWTANDWIDFKLSRIDTSGDDLSGDYGVYAFEIVFPVAG